MEENLAVLIDFENIAAGTEKEGLGRFDIDALMDRIKDKGRILVARSYGDWGRFARFKQEMLSANITMMELTSHGMQDKNRADIAMVVDCLELAFTRSFVTTFVIVSGDSDFTPLVLKMRELNKRVIGVGTRGSTSRLIINACDEFVFYDTIVKAKKRPERAVAQRIPKDRARAFELVVEIVLGLQREDPSAPLASVVKTALSRRQPDFSEEDLGFNSFTRFLEAARDAKIITLQRDAKSGGYRVDTVESEDTAAPEAVAAPPPAARPQDIPEDSYYPPGSQAVLALLAQESLSPTAAPTRLALLEALVDAVRDRDEKKRRVTIPFIIEDIKRRLRRTHPDLSARAIKDVLGALLRGHQLMHKDGSPIRSANAPFTLSRDAGALNQALTELYLRFLRHKGADLSDVSMLAELFLGDRERRREIETTLAWLGTDAGEGDDLESGRNPMDDLIIDEEPARPSREGREGSARGASTRDGRPAAPARAPAARDDDADGRRRRGRGRGGRDREDEPRGGAPSTDEFDAFLEAEDTPTAPAAAARPAQPAQTTRSRAPVAEAFSDDIFEIGDSEPPATFTPADDLPPEPSSFDALFEIMDEEPPARKPKPAAPPPAAPPAPEAAAPPAAEALAAPEAARKPRAPRKKAAVEAAPAEEALPSEASPADGPAEPARKPRSRAKKKTDTAADLDAFLSDGD